jgi:hypothetical protein
MIYFVSPAKIVCQASNNIQAPLCALPRPPHYMQIFRMFVAIYVVSSI